MSTTTSDGPIDMDAESKLAVHEAVCAERWKAATQRLARIEYVLGAIVILLLFGQGTVLEVVKRLAGVK